MATPKASSLQALTLISLLFFYSSANPQPLSTTLPLFHAQPSNLPWSQTLNLIFSNDASRLLFLSNLASSQKTRTPIASTFQTLHTPNYIISASLGNPPQTLPLALDTSNDVSWLPCSPPSSLFNSLKSSSFSHILCSNPRCQQVPNPSCRVSRCFFNMSHGPSSLQASLSSDTLQIATDNFTDFTFGCLTTETPTSSLPPLGFLGLGRGPISFISQTDKTYHSTFSYCLPSLRSVNFSGSLRLGPLGQPKNIKTTPILLNPRRPSLYYVELTGISVGRHLLPIPATALAFNAATGGGTIIDSGTMFTRLVAPAYAALRDEFRRRVDQNATSLGGFDTCYQGPITAPNITFLFKGMNVTLPPDNTLIHSSSGSTVCLAMAGSPDNVNSVLNVIAGMQQQNHRIFVDLPNKRIGVARELCTV